MSMNISGLMKSKTFGKLVLKKSGENGSSIYYVEVPPRTIGHISVIPESSPWLVGPHAASGIFHGIFDLLKHRFDRHFMYLTVQKILQGIDIRETEYYSRLLKTLDEEDAVRNVEKLLWIINRLRKSGYLSQYEKGNLDKTRSIGRHTVPLNETIIGMDREGKLFRLAGGRHRLAVAQHLGLEKMSAVLSLVHQNAVNKLPRKSRLIRNYPEDLRPF
jgi:hypothetical protein